MQRELEQDALIRVLKERLVVSEAGGGGREKELQGTIDKLRNGRYMYIVCVCVYFMYVCILYSNKTVCIFYTSPVYVIRILTYTLYNLYTIYIISIIYTENIEMTTTISRLHQQIHTESLTSKNHQSAEKSAFLSEISDLKKKLSWYIDNQMLIDLIQTEKEYYKNIIKLLKNELIINGISRDNIYKLISTIPSASVQNSGKKGQNYDPSTEDDDVRDISINTTSVSTTHIKDKHSNNTSSGSGNIRKHTAVTGAARPQDTKRIR